VLQNRKMVDEDGREGIENMNSTVQEAAVRLGQRVVECTEVKLGRWGWR
jgi:hypothetical protein